MALIARHCVPDGHVKSSGKEGPQDTAGESREMIDDARTKDVVVSSGLNVAGIHATRAQENTTEWMRAILKARMFLYSLIKQFKYLFEGRRWRCDLREKEMKEHQRTDVGQREVSSTSSLRSDILGIETQIFETVLPARGAARKADNHRMGWLHSFPRLGQLAIRKTHETSVRILSESNHKWGETSGRQVHIR